MATLNKTGYLVTVYTDYDCYTYHFDEYEDAVSALQDYHDIGRYAEMKIRYSIG